MDEERNKALIAKLPRLEVRGGGALVELLPREPQARTAEGMTIYVEYGQLAELAMAIMIAARHLVDKDGLRVYARAPMENAPMAAIIALEEWTGARVELLGDHR